MAERTRSQSFDRVSRILLIGLALLTAAAAFWRVFGNGAVDRVDETTLYYLGVAGALLLLKEVKSLVFKDFKLDFDRIEEIAKDAQKTAQNAQTNAIGIGKNADEPGPETRTLESKTSPAESADPWKGKFGGKANANHRKLEAVVARIPSTADLFSIHLRVSSTHPNIDPLRGVVQFFLHPTFRNPQPIVSVDSNGVAELRLTAWGAFTVGVLADEGRTRLELDLAELSDAPEDFRNR